MSKIRSQHGLFDRFIGVDYSGADRADKRLNGLSLFTSLAKSNLPAQEVHPVGSSNKWSRALLAEHLIEICRSDSERCLIGLDHGLGFPSIYYENHNISSWSHFLSHLTHRWPQLREGKVEEALTESPVTEPNSGLKSFRLCETWTTGPSSVFRFHHNGAVGKSTFAGLAQIQQILTAAGESIHVWPFDGWIPDPSKHVICEIYPSLYKKRYPVSDTSWSPHQWDAYAATSWMQDMQSRRVLNEYFQPPLTTTEKDQAQMEGWILGVR